MRANMHAGAVRDDAKTIDDLAAFETRDFRMRLDNYSTQRSFLVNSLKRTDNELESLKDDQARNTEGLKLQQAAVDRMGNSANKGVVSTSRVDEERRVLAELRSQQGDVPSRLVVAQRNRDELARNIELQDEQHRTQLNENLREATIETEKLAGRLRASGEKLLYTGAVKSQLRHDTEGLDTVVHRMADGRLTEIAATEDTEILPDDMLEVTIRPEQMIGAPDSN